MATKNIKALGNAQALGWTDALLSRLAANSVGLGARLSITAPADASALSSTGYSLTGSNTSSMIDLAGTWNTSGTPTLIKANVTDTASDASSLLMDLQVGGSSKFSITKNGTVAFSPTFTINAGTQIAYFKSAGTVKWLMSTNGGEIFSLGSGGAIGWSFETNASQLSLNDLILRRDAANTLALRNSTNAQAFNIYNTYTSGSVYERGFMRWVSNVLEIGTEHVGANARSLVFKVNAFTFITISTSSVTFGSDINFATASAWRFESRSGMTSPSDGVLTMRNNASTDFNRLQFGGTSSSFPALKRSSTALQSRLADDSDFAPLQGRLLSHANATSETVTPTHTLRLFDAAGTEYRVPAIAV